MKLLVLGGTLFLGRHVVEAALARGHEVTLFNRGRHNPDLFPEAEKLRGDREGSLAALRGRTWDRVIDTSGHLPRVVRASAAALADAVDHYTFVSTIWVYRAYPHTPGIDESFPLATLADPTTEKLGAETFGPLKALCEDAVAEAMGGRALAIRPGLIVGPYEPTGRFAYWPRRVARGGEILLPAPPSFRLQVIDARDLAGWLVLMSELGHTGCYNATGPAYPLTLQHLVEVCRAVCESDASFTWVDERFVLEAGVVPNRDLPLWFPGAPGLAAVNCGRAIAAGLTFRPLADTVRGALAEDAGPAAAAQRLGLDREREAGLLRAWHERSRSAALRAHAPLGA